MDVFYVSQYLNLYPSHRNTMILFGGISGAIDEIDLSFGKTLASFKHSKKPISQDILSGVSDSEIQFLVKRGHLTKLSPDDEYKSFFSYVDKLHSHLNKGASGSLMIVPNYFCNLACPYCFQNGMREKFCQSDYKFMTPQEADEIFELAIPQLFPNEKHLNKISICLYGGEPFLKRNTEVISVIMQHTVKNQMDVSAISNATEINEHLKWFGPQPGYVNNVQITLDGDKGHHDQLRIGKDRSATFEKILENIHLLIDLNVQINLRLNISRNNLAGLKNLMQRLESEELLFHPKVHTYAWAVHCHELFLDRKIYLTNWELSNFLDANTKGIETPAGRRQRRLRRLFNSDNNIFLKRTSFCMRSVPNSYLIDTYGDIYGCYEEAGHKETRIGCFTKDKGVYWEPRYKENLTRHVARCDPCCRCSVALTCGGGCPFASQKKYKTQFRNDCDSHKECVAKSIQRLFKEKIENTSEKNDRTDFWDLYPNA